MTELIKAPPVSPARIFELSCAYWNTRILLSAAEVGIFSALDQAPETAQGICDKLGLHHLAIEEFLDSLAALGLIRREHGRYYNSEMAQTYLVPRKPHYMGGYLEFVRTMLWPGWVGLTDTLRTGRPQFPGAFLAGRTDQAGSEKDGASVSPGDVFAQVWGNPETRRLLLEATDALNTEIAWEMTRHIDFSGWKSLVDLGGSRGNVASILLSANPHLSATIFDLEPLRPLFDEHMRTLGLQDRARFQPGDWFADPLPDGDALLTSHALHNWNTEQRRLIIGKAYHAVRPGGVLMICELMLDDARTRLNPLLLSLLMKLGMGGSGYTTGECRALLAEAGFTDIQAVTLEDYDRHTVMIGHKRA